MNRADPVRPPSPGHVTDPARVVPLVLVGAAVVGVSGVVLGDLPLPGMWHLNHGSLPVVADEAARTGLLVLAAVAALAGGLRWRRWAAGAAALHVLGVALRWALSDGPGGFARIEVWRGLAAATLAVAVGRTAGPLWVGTGRRWRLGGLTFLVGVSVLGGLRQSITLAAAGSVLGDALRTGGGLAVVVAAAVAAVLVARVDEGRLAVLHLLGASVLAGGALAGDLAVWWLEGRPGSIAVLAVRAALVVAALVVAWRQLTRGHRLRARPDPVIVRPRRVNRPVAAGAPPR